jgi:hypothetical protein
MAVTASAAAALQIIRSSKLQLEISAAYETLWTTLNF